jgi:hypothetical protein
MIFYAITFKISISSNSVLVFSMQYAHRTCVQRWCNEKGDVTCEICHEVILSYEQRTVMPISQ